MRLSDTALAVLFMLLAAAMFAMTTTFPAFPGQNYGPSLFPRILSVGIMICGILLIVRDRGRRDEGKPAFSLDPLLREPYRLVSFLLVPGAIIAYLLLVDWLGFVPVCFFIMLGLMLWFGVKKLTALAVSLIMTFVLHWFFSSLMRVPLPRGLFMQIVQGG